MALIYSKAKKDAIDRAVAKAKAVKPFVKVLGYCEFEVEGPGGKYVVKFSKQSGEFVATCGCEANKYGNVCYHVISCAGVMKKQVADRAAEKAAPCVTEGCPMKVAEAGLECERCIQEEINDREEFLYTEILQPAIQRGNIWARWDAVEAKEAANPEPEHTKYEESIAEARRALFG